MVIIKRTDYSICIGNYVFTGIVGTVKENYCCLLLYTIFLGLAVFTEIAMAVSLFAVAADNRPGSFIDNTMRESLEHFDQPGYEGVTKGMQNKAAKAIASVASWPLFPGYTRYGSAQCLAIDNTALYRYNLFQVG